MAGDPVYKNVMDHNGTGGETRTSSSEITQRQKSDGYSMPSTQEPGETYGHYNERLNSWFGNN